MSDFELNETAHRERRMGWLFMMAMASRTLMFSLGTHWGTILVLVLVGSPIEWAAEYTALISLLFIVVVVVLFATLNGNGQVSDRMKRGPEKLLDHSVAIIIVAIASDVGGIVLYIHGDAAVAMWAMALSTAVAILESTALVGTSYYPGDSS
jgi:hypothetical protein